MENPNKKENKCKHDQTKFIDGAMWCEDCGIKTNNPIPEHLTHPPKPTKEGGENPTRQHSMKCPKLYGEDCACDGYHTFDELYEHRCILWIKLCDRLSGQKYIWASVKHFDGTTFGDWFILGMNDEKGKQITYHLPARFWNEVCEFANILEKAPEFDGHTSDDVVERLKTL